MPRRKAMKRTKVIGSSKHHLPLDCSIDDPFNSEDDSEPMDVDGAKPNPKQKRSDPNDLSKYNLDDYDNDEADPTGKFPCANPVPIHILIRS